MYLNECFILGNLTKDPELRYTAQGDPVVNFTVALNRKYTTKTGEKKEETSFIGCVAWAKTAELVNEYLKKGSACLVKGRLQQDSYEDADGKKQSKTKVIAESVQFLSKPKPVEIEETTPF
jgi:single-strand DNA-binding protein